MFSGNKTFSAFDSPQKPLRFVRVNCVLNVFAVRKQFKIVQTIVRAIQILMVNFHTFWNGAVKRLPHRAMDGYLSVLSIFARAEPDIVVPRYVRFNRPRGAIASPRFAVFNIKRSRNAGVQQFSNVAQRAARRKHILGDINLLGAKQLASRYASNARKIADFVKAFIAADRFPNLHAVDIKPVYVGDQA
jgi:hypothetical protein